MSRATATAFLFLIATSLAHNSPNEPSLKGRTLPENPPLQSQLLIGGGAFLLSFLLQIALDPSDTIADHTHNELFLGAATAGETEGLEIILAYATTFQKDLRVACKQAMMTRVSDAERHGPLKSRCEFWAETTFKQLPMTPLLFDIQFAFKTFYILHRDERLAFRSVAGEAAELVAENDQLFFDTLGKVIDEVLAGKDEDAVQIRFHLIQRFYQPKFAKIIGTVLDGQYKLVRAPIYLDQKKQDLLDLALGVPAQVFMEENYRLRRDRHELNAADRLLPGYDTQNIYRFYGRHHAQPLYDVKKIFKIFNHE